MTKPKLCVKLMPYEMAAGIDDDGDDDEAVGIGDGTTECRCCMAKLPLII